MFSTKNYRGNLKRGFFSNSLEGGGGNPGFKFCPYLLKTIKQNQLCWTLGITGLPNFESYSGESCNV